MKLEDIHAQLALEELHQQDDIKRIALEGGPDMQERIERCEREYRRRYNQITSPLTE